MKPEKFYLELGNIDDDLIEEAANAKESNKLKIAITRFASIAACLCLICTALFFTLRNDIIFNKTDTPISAKVLLPADHNTSVLPLTYQELFDYYSLNGLPDTLFDLHRSKGDNYYIYRTPENVVYDTNILRYSSDGGDKILSVLIAKEKGFDSISTEKLKSSKIDGVSVVLAVSNDSSRPIYWAEMKIQTAYWRVIANGIDKASFTNIIKELIYSQK